MLFPGFHVLPLILLHLGFFSSAQSIANPIQIQPVGREIILPPSETFSGDLEKCRGFLLQSTLVFQRSLYCLLDDASKISYIIGLLRNKALRFAEAIIQTTIQFY
ncbi:hypothetical protein ATANTOWER_025422 [Ataeniobius toweri]|uniref:Uncharacterized protein n=1 Tax=Ataeniobius toweri TaxID=208326 RepID=A0ABU7AH31_9TELE|nr:hypothetical protein [Ataeniobius toweri]